MTFDLAESFRGELLAQIACLEESLLGLDDDPGQPRLGEVFRAAHNIKSAAAMMGMGAAAEHAHGLETELDQMRSGALPIDRAGVTRLLAAVDALRALVAEPAAPSPAARPARPGTAERRVEVRLALSPDAMTAELDPLALLFALADLGTVESSAIDDSALPPLGQLDPDTMYLRFEVVLSTAASMDDLRTVFLFAEDRIELELVEVRADGPPPARAAAPKPADDAPHRAQGTLAVGVRKVDTLVDLAGELAVATSELERLRAVGATVADERMESVFRDIRRLTGRIQEAAVAMRLVPLESTFALLRRYIRDQSVRMGKEVAVEIRGAQTELDKSVADRLFDALKHLVRNALDHGLETPDERRAAGKDPVGRLVLSARQAQGEVVVVVEDDGRGLDRDRIREAALQRGHLGPDAAVTDAELLDLLFAPGFTTAADVGELSGRGVGLDVVRRSVIDIGGELRIDGAPGQGCRVTLEVPMNLTMLEGLVVRCGAEQLVVPTDDVDQLVIPAAGQIGRLPDGREVLRLPAGPVPVVRPGELLGFGALSSARSVAVLVTSAHGRLALQVDEVVSQEPIMLKSLQRSLRITDVMLGAGLLGDGRVALVLDVARVHAMEGRAGRGAASAS